MKYFVLFCFLNAALYTVCVFNLKFHDLLLFLKILSHDFFKYCFSPSDSFSFIEMIRYVSEPSQSTFPVSYNSFIFISLSFWAVFWVNSSELSSNSQILSLTMTNVVFTQYCFICSYLYILIPYYSTAAELQSTSFCSRIWFPAMENFIFLLNMNCTKMSTLI